MPDMDEDGGVLVRVLDKLGVIQADIAVVKALSERHAPQLIDHEKRLDMLEQAEVVGKALRDSGTRRITTLAGFSGAATAIVIDLISRLVPFHR